MKIKYGKIDYSTLSALSKLSELPRYYSVLWFLWHVYGNTTVPIKAMLSCLQDLQQNREEKHWSICHVKSVLHPRDGFTAMPQKHPLRGALTNDCVFLTPDGDSLAWFLSFHARKQTTDVGKKSFTLLVLFPFFSHNVFSVLDTTVCTAILTNIGKL